MHAANKLKHLQCCSSAHFLFLSLSLQNSWVLLINCLGKRLSLVSMTQAMFPRLVHNATLESSGKGYMQDFSKNKNLLPGLLFFALAISSTPFYHQLFWSVLSLVYIFYIFPISHSQLCTLLGCLESWPPYHFLAMYFRYMAIL